MAIHDNLLSGQFSPLDENRIDHSLSATAKVMPLHPGNKRPSIHRAPRKKAHAKATAQ